MPPTVIFALLAIGQLAIVLPGWSLYERVGGLGPYLLAAYLLFFPVLSVLVAFRLMNRSPRFASKGLFLLAWLPAFATLGVAFEIQSQLVRIDLPIRVQNPVRMTAIFLGYIALMGLVGWLQARNTARTAALPLRFLPSRPHSLPAPAPRYELATQMSGPLAEKWSEISHDRIQRAQTPPRPIISIHDPSDPGGGLSDAPPPEDEASDEPATKASSPEPTGGTTETGSPASTQRALRLLRVAQQLADQRELSTFGRTVLDGIEPILAAPGAVVFSHDRSPNRYRAVAVSGPSGGPLRGLKIPAAAGLISRLLEQGRPISSDRPEDVSATGLPAEFRSIHLFPLVVIGDEIRMVLALLGADIAEDDRQLIEQFCEQVSLIQENRWLRAERQLLNKEVSHLIEIAKSVSATTDPEELFAMILGQSTDFVQAEQGSLMLLNEQKRELSVKATKGLNKQVAELVRIRSGEGIAGKVLATGLPLLVSDIEMDDRVTQERRPRYRTKSFISVPLKLQGRTIGVLNVTDKVTGEVFSEQDLQLLTSIGTYASVAIERSRYHLKTEELKKISITDPLTGLLNRRYFQERISEEIERSRRHGLPLSLILLDLDDFKAINDSYGHMAGDEVLQTVARSIRNSVRTIDVAARYGGEEFTVILPQTAKSDATSLAERICVEAGQLEFPYMIQGRPISLTVSLGVATYPEDAENLEDLIRNADAALYEAKAQGKNRVVVFKKS